MNSPLVVGLGSHHGDDQAGWLVIDRLESRQYPAGRFVRLRHPAELLNMMDREQSLIICDAGIASNHSGMIHHFDWPDERLVYQRPSGSHDLSLLDAMQLGRQLGQTPERAEVWILEGETWEPGSEPSTTVRTAAARLADIIFDRCGHA